MKSLVLYGIHDRCSLSFIIIEVRPRGITRNSFRVVSQIHGNPEVAPGLRNWLGIQECASQKAAYEFGLQETQTWIDAQMMKGNEM